MKKKLGFSFLILMLLVTLIACRDNLEEPKANVAEHAESPNNIEFKFDKTMIGDSPEGTLSVFEAQELLAETVQPEKGKTALEGCQFCYLFQGIVEIEGKEAYYIDFGSGNATDFTPERSFAVSLDGEIYEGPVGGKEFTTYALYNAHKDVKGD